MKKISKKKTITEIARKYSLSLLVLFGSRATGKALPSSDIDIAFQSKKTLSLAQETALAYDLSLFFANDAIDIVNLKKTSPLLLYAIFKDGKVLYEAQKFIFAHMRGYAFKQFVEAAPLYRDQHLRLTKKYGV
ncbi:nucleotidyltransferase domain-containing protein [Candidatus Uhrbacteria bacterium]|nr:nucleotidyltransferase domain-containing protein [Candidatus Uhrbacteria bacterium]